MSPRWRGSECRGFAGGATGARLVPYLVRVRCAECQPCLSCRLAKGEYGWGAEKVHRGVPYRWRMAYAEGPPMNGHRTTFAAFGLAICATAYLHAQQIGGIDLLRGLSAPSRWLIHSGDYSS